MRQDITICRNLFIFPFFHLLGGIVVKKKTRIKVIPKHRKHTEEAKPARKPNVKRIGLAVIALLAVVAIGIFYFTRGNVAPETEGEVVILVNGEPITQEELDTQYNRLPDYYKSSITKDDLLQQLIEEKLLLQAARKEGIAVSESEVSGLINALLEQNQLTQEELEFRLSQQNISFDELKDFYMRELMITKLINKSVISKVEVTPDEISQFYEDNLDQMIQPEGINVSHIIICHNESLMCYNNRSKDEAEGLLADIRTELTLDNFGDMAREYSEEPAASYTGGNLGFISPQDPYDTDFLDAAFSLDEGEISDVVETQFGFHVIAVFENRPESTIPLGDVYEEINQSLTIEKQQTEFTDFVEKLKEEADLK